MGRKDRNFYHAKNLAVTYSTTSTTEYRAPTVGLEDQVFTFGKAKDATKFEVVKEELGKYFDTQTLNNGDDDAWAFDTSKEQVYNWTKWASSTNSIRSQYKYGWYYQDQGGS